MTAEVVDGVSEMLPPAARRPESRASTGLYVRSPNGLKLRSRKVQRLVQHLRKVLPWLEPADTPAARGWAELEILSASVFAELVTGGVLTPARDAVRLLHDYRMLKLAQ